MPQTVSIPIGVIVARHEVDAPRQDATWRVAAVVLGTPAVTAGSLLWCDGPRACFYAGSSNLILHPTETASYRSNLEQQPPLIYAVIGNCEITAPSVVTVTAAPDEAAAYLDSSELLVDVAEMPRPLADLLVDFIARHDRQATPSRGRECNGHTSLAQSVRGSR